jgi:hypothetical protein
MLTHSLHETGASAAGDCRNIVFALQIGSNVPLAYTICRPPGVRLERPHLPSWQ